MQESNFEKQVQQKMDELILNPSGTVWQKVADTLAKRKGNRRVIAIILLALLFVGSTVFFLLNQTKTKFDASLTDKIVPQKMDDINESKGGNNIPKKDMAPGISNRTGENSTAGSTIIPRNVSVSKAKNARQIRIPAQISTQSSGQLTTSENIGNPTDKKVKEVVRNKSNNINYNNRQQVKMKISSTEPEELVNEVNAFVDTGKAVVLEDDIKINHLITGTLNKVVTDIGKLSADTIAVIQILREEKKVDITKVTQPKQKAKWQFGLNFSAGFAATKSSYLGIIGLGNTDELKALDPAQLNTGTTGTGAGISIPYTPSEIKPGAGNIMGVFMQQGISRKTNLQFGLNYKSYNSSMQIGNRVDSNLSYGGNLFTRDNFFYRAGTKGNYKNHFHFIELPVSVRIKLGKQNKLPVYLNSGFTISQLITTNALQFDALSGSYYRDNAVFNKTQFNISAGLLLSLSGNTQNAFLIGPDLNFSLTKMANSGLYKNRHYSYIGIQLRKGIGKK